jgi:hypothetical protein
VYTILTLKFSGTAESLEQIRQVFAGYPRYSIQFINLKEEFLSGTTTYSLRLLSKDVHQWEDIKRKLSEIKGLDEIAWGESDVP